MNYYALNDPLLSVVPSATRALQVGTLFLNDPEFIFLTPKGNDPMVDHGLMGPTYVEALRWEADRFKVEYESVMGRRIRELVIRYQVSISKRTECICHRMKY